MDPRILCATDFSESAREAMHVAADLARQSNALLELVQVEDRPLWTKEPFVHLPGDVRQASLDAAARELEAWRDDAERRAGGKVVARTTSGVPWEAIVAVADADPTIQTIVVGTHGRKGLSRALLGSVAERVARHAPCSVLVVRPSRPG
jgi:nucleotide-binding universal stress UspA family protein